MFTKDIEITQLKTTEEHNSQQINLLSGMLEEQQSEKKQRNDLKENEFREAVQTIKGTIIQ